MNAKLRFYRKSASPGITEDNAILMLQAREVLETPSTERLENLVNQLFTRYDSDEYQSANTLYMFCAEIFPDGFTMKLLQVYLSSSNRIVRFRSIYVLSDILTGSDINTGLINRGYGFLPETLCEIKPLLISCLEMQETQDAEIKLFRRILSFIAFEVVILDDNGWKELSECILFLSGSHPRKAFNVFVDLPIFCDDFISGFKDNILEQAYKVLQNPIEDGEQDWSLALQTALKIGIQLIQTNFTPELADEILSNLVKVASELVEKGMEEFLVRGLVYLERFLLRDKNLYNYNSNQCVFVKAFLVKIKELGIEVNDAVGKIIQPFDGSYNPTILRQDHKADLGDIWYDHIMSLSPPEVLGILASTDLEVMYRGLALKLVNVLLSGHSEGKVNIDISVMTSLQPVLISCLKEEGLPDEMFKILCQVVNYVAEEMVKSEDGKWDGLREYFASESKKDFRRAVNVFQSLKMSLEDEFLLPEISTRLRLPEDLSVDNSNWVLAFTGAFSAIIKLIEIKDHGAYVKSTAHQMISSVEYLVERGMEDRYVRKAFSELESLVKNQLGWYTSTVYKFVKGLLWSFYQIKGMKMESKVVLWRINVRVEKGVNKQLKELVNPEYDWLNQPMTDDVN